MVSIAGIHVRLVLYVISGIGAPLYLYGKFYFAKKKKNSSSFIKEI